MVYDGVVVQTIGCLNKTTPCTGNVCQTSDDGSTIDMLQSCTVQYVAAQHSQDVICLCAGCHESLNMLSDIEVVSNDHAKHLQAAAVHDSWQRCWIQEHADASSYCW